jgi:UDP-glucose 4-epimerase
MGFIASHLVKKYAASCTKIYLIDNLSTNSLSPDSDFLRKNKNIEFLKMDLSQLNEFDVRKFEEILADVSLVFHFASPVGVKHIDYDPKTAIQSLFYTTSTLFPLFEKHNKKVIYSSSSEVYGETEDAKETNSLSIGSPDRLRWGYACGKLMSEFMLRSHSFPFVILRFFNVTGPGQLSDGMVMPNFINKAKSNEDLMIFDRGNQKRSFCDIRDAIEMIDILSHDQKFEGEIFNIGNSENLIAIDSLADLVIITTKSSSQKTYKDFEKAYSRETGEIYSRRPNTAKLESIYKCKYSIEDTIHYFLESNGIES